MSRRPPRNHSAAFKAKVALAAIPGEKILAELAEQFDVRANQITQWKSQLPEGAAGVFGEAKATSVQELVEWRLFTPRSAPWRWRTISQKGRSPRPGC
jgi:transposase-like protein